MTQFQTLVTIGGGIFTLLAALVGFIVRATMRWTRVELQLVQLGENIKKLVEDKDKTHREITNQMHEDRQANNERLTWLERNLYNRHLKGG